MRSGFLVLIAIIVPALSFGDWDIEVPCADTSGKSAAIGVDSNNNPHIVYYVDGDHFYHVYKSDSVWYGPYPIESVNYYTYCRVIDLAMIADTANALMVMDWTASGDYVLWGKHIGSGIWTVEQVPNTLVSSNSGGYLNVAIAPGAGSTLFHVIYIYYNYGSPIIYYRKYNGTWTAAEEVSSMPEFSAGSQNDVAVDGNDDPHVGFAYSDEGIKYRRKASGVWEPVELVSTTTDPNFASIAVDNSNYPHVAYDKDDFGAVCYRTKTASSWQPEETVGTGGGWNTYGASITVSGGEIFVAYYAAGDLKFAMRSTTGWTSEDVDTLGDVGKYASLAIDTEGYAHAAYYDATNERLKYAKSTEPVVNITEDERAPYAEPRGYTLHACPNPFQHTTRIRFMIHDTGYTMGNWSLVIYDASGRLVKYLNPESCIMDHGSAVSWDGADNTGQKLPCGVYFARLTVRQARTTGSDEGMADHYSVTEKLLLIE